MWETRSKISLEINFLAILFFNWDFLNNLLLDTPFGKLWQSCISPHILISFGEVFTEFLSANDLLSLASLNPQCFL